MVLMVWVLALSLLLFLCGCSWGSKVFPTNLGPAEVINLNGNGVVFAKTANLQLDDTDVNSTIKQFFLLADKGSSNLFTGVFSTKGGDNSFWVESKSPILNLPTGPFLNFDVVGDNVIGVALPNSVTPTFSGPLIQSIWNSTQLQFNTDMKGFDFVTTYISPLTDGKGNTYVFFAGWNTDFPSIEDSFVVVRGTIKIGSPDPIVTILPIPDTLTIDKVTGHCYDMLSVRSKPSMVVDGDYLYLVLPGKCAMFSKIKHNVPTFSGAEHSTFDPKTDLTEYVPSAIYDNTFKCIYYVKKTYRSMKGATLHRLDANSFQPDSTSVPIDLDQSEAITVIATETINAKVYRWLYILGSGSNKILRLEYNGTAFNIVSSRIDPSISQISSAFYYRPWLFYTTYEPDAKLVRIPKTNFCILDCGDNAFCESATCHCNVGYAYDLITQKCVPSSLVVVESSEMAGKNSTIALGVLFALSVLLAIIGWMKWWSSQKHVKEQEPLRVTVQKVVQPTTQYNL